MDAFDQFLTYGLVFMAGWFAATAVIGWDHKRRGIDP